MALTKIDDRGLTTPIDLLDNEKIRFGTGNDLEIYHNANNSYIQDTGTGNLHLTSNGTAVSIDKGTSENMAVFNIDGAVELFYDGVKRFETTSYGFTSSGYSSIGDGTWAYLTPDSNKSAWGDNQDLQIYHNGTSSYIANTTGPLIITQHNNDIHLRPKTAEEGIIINNDGAVELFHNGNKKLETTNTGVTVTGRAMMDVNLANNYGLEVFNDGNSNNRYGIYCRCGQDDPTSTNYAMAIVDGDATVQGYVTFTGGTVTWGAFTAHHPCIIPDADNPSDASMAYPYGTLLETISIEYTQKNGSNTERGIRYKVQKTQSANSRKVLGAYGGSMNGGPDGQTNEHQALILGDGHILVNNAGGNIEVGDGICSSATAGIGQKATANPSMIIGIAQEAVTFTGSETKLVAVQYGLQQFIPWT